MTDQPSTDVMDAVAQMFAANARRRADRANTALSVWTRYERRLVRESAVMGYVLGYQSGNLDGRSGFGGPADRNNPIPPDSEILQRVIEHCDSTDDKCPFIAGACAGHRRRVTRKQLWPGEVAS